jgi:hypothetical protein
MASPPYGCGCGFSNSKVEKTLCRISDMCSDLEKMESKRTTELCNGDVAGGLKMEK